MPPKEANAKKANAKKANAKKHAAAAAAAGECELDHPPKKAKVAGPPDVSDVSDLSDLPELSDLSVLPFSKKSFDFLKAKITHDQEAKKEEKEKEKEEQKEKKPKKKPKNVVPEDIVAKIEEIIKKHDLVGCRKFKKKVRKWAYMLWNDKKRKELKKEPLDKRLPVIVLMGPTGTGKNTMAMIISELVYELGMTKSPDLRVCSAADLIAQHVGGTHSKTCDLMKTCEGDAVFVDEAYSIVHSGENSYGGEAMAAMLPFLENNHCVCILAGYGPEMTKFLSANSGFPSRVTHKFFTELLTAKDLGKIMKKQLHKSKLDLDKKITKVFLTKQFETVNESTRREKNARLVKDVIELAKENLAVNLGTGEKGEVTKDNVSFLGKDDVTEAFVLLNNGGDDDDDDDDELTTSSDEDDELTTSDDEE